MGQVSQFSRKLGQSDHHSKRLNAACLLTHLLFFFFKVVYSFYVKEA